MLEKVCDGFVMCYICATASAEEVHQNYICMFYYGEK